MDIPKLVNTTLKDYQIEGFKWMKDRENNSDGGMLMDEPGLGKSLQIICLIADSYSYNNKTLIICPANVVGTWKNEILKHTNILEDDIYVYTGSNRKKNYNKNSYKIIITSYSILRSDKHKEFKKRYKEEFSDDSIFNNEEFERIVLDEAHHIKNKETISAKLCFKLKGKKKWIVTATPIQNGIMDLYSLFKFLGYEWKKDIKYLNEVLNKHGIRRLKKDVLNLTEKKENDIVLEFNKKDKEFYNVLINYLKIRINVQIEKYKYKKKKKDTTDVIVNNMRFNSVKTMILRLRQACNSPQLVINGMKRLNGYTIDEAIKELKVNVEDDCIICMDKRVNCKIEPCGHEYFCNQCITSVLNRCNACPICKCVVNDIINSKEKKKKENIYMDSTKIQNIMEIIEKNLRNDKLIIVCSQWVKMLDLIFLKFKKIYSGVKYIELTGNVSIKKRQEMINEFQQSSPVQHSNKDKRIKVVFISLMASSEGITLTNASVVIHVDPWWNSQKTLQATDRTHRIGQKEDVMVYYLFINNTIEMLMKKHYIEKKNKYVDAIVEGKMTDTWIDKMIKFMEELKEIL